MIGSTEEFSVALFFPNGDYMYEAQGLGAEAAVTLAKQCTERPAAQAGLIRRVIIIDAEDFTVFEWRYGKGVTYPHHDGTRFVTDDDLGADR